jgi:tetratricopeptide (TPR) repeat protein
LIELESEANDWQAASLSVQRLLEVNPLLPQAQKARAATSERLGKTEDAIKGLEAWLLMDPDDPADAHYRLGRLLHSKGDPRAKSHVLAALESAPRFRDAQRLLLKIVRESPADAQNPVQAAVTAQEKLKITK